MLFSKNLHILFLSIILAGIITGCKKKGCTVPYAFNYDQEADEDNGSCIYYKVGFYYTTDSAESYLSGKNEKISHISVTAGNKDLGKIPSVLTEQFNSCTASEVLTYTLSGESEVEWRAYIILQDSAWYWDGGKIKVLANRFCIPQKVHY